MDDCVAIGSRKEFSTLAKSVDAQYSIAGVGEVRWVLGMLLEHDRPARVISKSKEAFIDSIIARFNLTDATTLATPLTPGAHLSAVDCPTWKDKMEEMANQPYRDLVGALAWTSRSPPVRSPAVGITSVASIGTRPNKYYVTSRAPSSGVSRWEAGFPRSLPSWTLTGEVIATTDAQSESIPSAEKVDDIVGLRDDKGVCGRFGS